MSEHRPDRDRLTAYLEGALSIDGMLWVKHHLQACGACREALAFEQQLLERLNCLKGIEPPPDFVDAVMARVAQQPAYRPPTRVPWRRVAAWGTGLAASLLLLLGVAAWQAVRSNVVGGDAPAVLYEVISGGVEFGGFLMSFGRQFLEPAYALAQALGVLVLRFFVVAANSGWMVQLAILLITVTLNYVFTRMVLNYQRRR
ncbi:MAG: anti-sigma factor family protein [Acidobacteriota bacterium]